MNDDASLEREADRMGERAMSAGTGHVAAMAQAKGLTVNNQPDLEREADAPGAIAARGEVIGSHAPVARPAAADAPVQGVFTRKVTGVDGEEDDERVTGDELDNAKAWVRDHVTDLERREAFKELADAPEEHSLDEEWVSPWAKDAGDTRCPGAIIEEMIAYRPAPSERTPMAGVIGTTTHDAAKKRKRLDGEPGAFTADGGAVLGRRRENKDEDEDSEERESDDEGREPGEPNHPTRVWDTAHDQLLAELPSTTPGVGGSPSAYPAVSGTGDRAAVARGTAVEVYELPGGRLLRTIAHGAPISAVAFGGLGRDLASGATDGSLVVTRAGGAQLVLPAASGGVDAVCFLPDGRVVASDARRRLRVFDSGGASLADLELPTRVASLRVSDTRLVGVPYTNDAAPAPLVDLERYRIVAQLDERVGRLLSARWTADGQILTAGTDGTARLWDGMTGQLLQAYRGSSRFLADAALASDNLVMAGGADGLLRFWDKDTGYLLWALPAHKSGIYGVHVDGGDIMTRGITGEVSRWTLASPGQVIQACSDRERCAILLR